MQTKSFLFMMLLAGVFSLSVSCTEKNRNRVGIDPEEGFKADAQMMASFGVVSKPAVTADAISLKTKQNLLVISKSALEKEFLMTANFLEEAPSPNFHGLRGRVVSFREKAGRLFLIDVTQKHPEIAGEIPQTLLLAEFPVVSSSAKDLTFDFEKGIRDIFGVSDMYASDSDGSDYKYSLDPVKVKLSYLDEVKLSDQMMMIKQIAQLESQSSSGVSLIPVEVRYTLSPYLPDRNFSPVLSPGFRNVGYFEAAPLLLQDGSVRINAMKWNENKTFKFAISANTPLEYRQAVRDGILYWNKILGSGKVEVVQLEDPTITAPDARFNIVQWVLNDAAGAAYADAQVDPRSGEVLHAQVYMPSAFARMGLENRFREIEERSKSRQIGLRGFAPSRLCDRPETQGAERMTTAMLGSDVPEEVKAKILNDSLASVVAHEVGHTLGLRHNFAASVDSQIDLTKWDSYMKDYMHTGHSAKGFEVASSVMDYLPFEADVFVGDRVSDPNEPGLSYDKAAFGVLYAGKAVPKNQIFCTDSDHAKYADCNIWDSSASPIQYVGQNHTNRLKSLPMRLLNKFIMGAKVKMTMGSKLVGVDQVALDPVKDAKAISSDRFMQVKFFTEGAHSIKVRSKYPIVTSGDEPSVRKEERAAFYQDINAVGGVDAYLAPIADDYAKTAIERFNQIIDDPKFSSGMAWDKSYSFSAEEIAVMKTRVKVYFEAFQDAALKQELTALTGKAIDLSDEYAQPLDEKSAIWADDQLSEDLIRVLSSRFDKYVLGKTGVQTPYEFPIKAGGVAAVTLPEYKYSDSIRMLAAGLFDGDHKAIEWDFTAKNLAATKLQADMSAAGDLDKVDTTMMPNGAVHWILINQKILKNF